MVEATWSPVSDPGENGFRGETICVCRWTDTITGVCPDLLGTSVLPEEVCIGTQVFFRGVKCDMRTSQQDGRMGQGACSQA